MSRERILKVALNVPLSRTFDYLPPAGSLPAPGCRVEVPFGRRRQVGIVLADSSGSDLPPEKLKRATAAIDAEPVLGNDDLELLRFTSNYYHHPVGEVVAAALPALLRQGRPLDATGEWLALTAAGRNTDTEALGRRAPRQAELLGRLRNTHDGRLEAGALNERQPGWRRAAKPLVDKGLAEILEAPLVAAERHEPFEPVEGPALNADQSAAVAAVRAAEGFAPFVLDGVTGSGKTEIYLQLIIDMLEAGRQVLVLVPEIGLTPQLVARFRARLGIEPVLLHSGLGDAERFAGWRRAKRGDARLVVGTRSAVFVPLARPGLIIVDEEHDPSLKQHEGLRYSARDLAISRAARASIPIVLGSATPSLELVAHCEAGRYTRLVLPERAGGAKPPAVRLVDTSVSRADEGLSETLVAAIRRHLDQGGQALMFINRRGYAPTLICSDCGHVAECARCDARMTVHAAAGQLRCHHCGSARPLDASCSECGATVRPLGEGTQRLEDALGARFPAATIRRIDSDSTQGKGAIDAALSEATLGTADVLVGTQLLSKGHHFPKLTLVGIVNADQGLFGTDFRADERLAQSVIQVAGRAGREDRAGEVLIQTAFPRHPFWKRLIDEGYHGVVEAALADRAAANWPPYSRLALIRASAHRQADAHAFLDVAAERVRRLDRGAMRVLGPVDAPMARRAGRYRAQLLLQSADRAALHAVLGSLRPALEEIREARRVRWSVDVDPIELC